MTAGAIEIVRLSILGGLLGLDGTAVGQFMLSRPLVAGALAGWLLGDIDAGITIGAVLELYLLVSFPTGGSRFPEGSTATVVAVGAALPLGGAGDLPLAVAMGLLWGQLGGATVTLQRHVNAHLAPQPGPRGASGRISPIQGIAVLVDFLRAFTVTAVGVTLGRYTVEAAAYAWPLSGPTSSALLLVGGAVSLGILLRDLGGFRRHRFWFAAGLAAGIVGVRFL